MNWKLVLEYDGSHFAGWQTQRPGVRTVQNVIQDALARLNGGTPPPLNAAGRTDAGVHALGQVAGTRLDKPFQPEVLARALNALLPPDVRVIRATPTYEGFDARRAALSRTYRYRILARRAPSAIWRNLAYHIPYPLERERMEAAGTLLIGTHDFGAFGTAPRPGGSTIRTVSMVQLKSIFMDETGPFLDIEICANAFLTHMVRRVAGTLIRVGTGKLDIDGFAAILASGDPTQGGPTVPAQGLYLIRVDYPPEET